MDKEEEGRSLTRQTKVEKIAVVTGKPGRLPDLKWAPAESYHILLFPVEKQFWYGKRTVYRHQPSDQSINRPPVLKMTDFFKNALGMLGGGSAKEDNDFVGQLVEVGNQTLRIKRVIAEGRSESRETICSNSTSTITVYGNAGITKSNTITITLPLLRLPDYRDYRWVTWPGEWLRRWLWVWMSHWVNDSIMYGY